MQRPSKEGQLCGAGAWGLVQQGCGWHSHSVKEECSQQGQETTFCLRSSSSSRGQQGRRFLCESCGVPTFLPHLRPGVRASRVKAQGAGAGQPRQAVVFCKHPEDHQAPHFQKLLTPQSNWKNKLSASSASGPDISPSWHSVFLVRSCDWIP